MVDEINQVMTETLTITLINLTLAFCVILFVSKNRYNRYYIISILGLSTGLLVIVKLSTLSAPLIIVVFILILKNPFKEKLVALGLFLTIAICPSVASTFAGINSEISKTWYGLVGYAIEFQSENPVDLQLSSDSKKLLNLALSKRAETWKQFPEIVREYDFTYQKVPISLYYSALPASRELGFSNVSPSYTSKLFREISISSFDANKKLLVKALIENLKVPTGLFRQDGQFLTMSKILKNPFVYFLLIPIFIRYISRRSEIDYLSVLLIFSFISINYLIVSVFNGPIPRYFYLYDPLLLYSIVIMWSKCLNKNMEYAE
jgi:4-amino-4-deoxy-L-arabinose transferase-like glycosyltransferase